MSDELYMSRALKLAEKARGRTSPNPMVGAVVVKDGSVAGEGFHARAGTAHAEVVALRAAGEDARGATLYVNLEPCCVQGRTPPCTEAVMAAGIARVVSAMEDPNPAVRGRGHEILRRAGIEVVTGVLEPAAKRLNEVFAKYTTTGRPFVYLKCAMTLDGKIATSNGDSKWVTGEQARLRVHKLRDAVDAVMVGRRTIDRDDPSLTTRLPQEDGRDAIRIVLDGKALTNPDARVLTIESAAPTWIVVSDDADAGKVDALRAAGAEIIEVPGQDGVIDISQLMVRLGKLGVTSLLIEGGAEVNAAAFESRIVDKYVFFVAPKIVGGEDALPPISGTGVTDMADALRLSECEVERVGDDVLIQGYARDVYRDN